jgi:hypothetical protein
MMTSHSGSSQEQSVPGLCWAALFFLAAQLLFMHNAEPFESQHIQQYLENTHHRRHLEIIIT